MPTYDYRCDACGHEFETFQSITENPKRKCPSCGRNKLQRLIGMGGGIIFKGSGFYETDYRSESYKAGQKADKPSTDSKPADSKKADSKKKPSAKKSSKKSSPNKD